MALTNTHTSYGSVAKTLHWLIAIIVLFMLLIGTFMGDFEKPVRGSLMTFHKSLGMTLLVLMVLRLVWRLTNPRPHLPDSVPAWKQVASLINHRLLYALLIIMPLTGLAMSTAADRAPNVWGLGTVRFPGIPISKNVAGVFSDLHSIIAWTILVLLLIHVAAALSHYFINKDQVLQRMLPKRTSSKKTQGKPST